MLTDILLGVIHIPYGPCDVNEYLVVRQFFGSRIVVGNKKISLCMRISAQQGIGPNKIPYMPLCTYDEMFNKVKFYHIDVVHAE
jgi:hypothetical protein